MKTVFTKSTFYSLILGLIVFNACTPSTPVQEENRDTKVHPNVILIITDDQGYGDMGCHGNPWIQTPNIDQLHSESIRLTNFHVGTTCAPTRSGLMTGRDCNRVGVWHTIMGRSLLRENEKTLPAVFKENGYKTGIFGKWHLGDNYPFRPQDRGFDEVLVHGGGGIGQTPDYWNNDYFDDVYFHNGFPSQFEGYCTDVWFTEAMKFIQKNKKKPFFLYLSTNAPHSPYHVAQEYIDLYASNPDIPNPAFYGMISNLDENLGQLREMLENQEIADHTILIFMTDNGTSAGVQTNEKGFAQKGYNYKMRGKKGSEYDGGHRVPFFLYWKDGELTGGRSIDLLTSYTDIMPTLMELCNLQTENRPAFDGKSLAPVFKGDSIPWEDRILFIDTQRKEFPEKWKNSAVMTKTWRLIRGNELYNMERDSMQRWNVARYYPRKVQELREAYESWWSGLEPTFSDDPAIIPGGHEYPMELTAHDWHTGEQNPPWNQSLIRRGQVNNGYWIINPQKTGRYMFELRRWPDEVALPFNKNIPRPVKVPGGKKGEVGKGLPFVKAKIQIGTQTDSIAVKPEDSFARFEFSLQPGKTRLQTWMTDTSGIERGAYYVYVRYLEN